MRLGRSKSADDYAWVCPPASPALGYQADDIAQLAGRAAESHFNLTSPYAPSESEFDRMIETVLD